MQVTRAILLSLLLLGSSIGATAQESVAVAGKADRTVHADRVLIIAHRGDSAIAPENTLPAFASAVKAGSDLIELDYHHTSDDVPVALHDATLDRTTDVAARWQRDEVAVRGEPLERVAMLDAGSWFDRRFRGTRVPTLEQSIRTIQDGSITLIERKAGDAKTCVDMLRQMDLLSDVVVQAFDWEYVAACRRLAPDLMLAALGGRELTDDHLSKIRETGAQVVAWHHRSLDREAIGRIHAAGFRAWAWTVDDRDRAEDLVDAGIDAIITNVPAQTRRWVGVRQQAQVQPLESGPAPALLSPAAAGLDP